MRCKRGDGDLVHVKREEGNTFHVAVFEPEGNEIDLPGIGSGVFNA